MLDLHHFLPWVPDRRWAKKNMGRPGLAFLLYRCMSTTQCFHSLFFDSLAN